MNSLLIASFEDESSARNAMKQLDDLALNGGIDLYERVLIRKTPTGRSQLYRESGSAGWQTITGALAGSLVGLFSRPVGFAIGLVSGAVVGSAISDRKQHNFGEEVIKSLETDISSGATVIVAHLGERSPELVDAVLDQFESHHSRSDYRDYQVEGAIKKISKRNCQNT